MCIDDTGQSVESLNRLQSAFESWTHELFESFDQDQQEAFGKVVLNEVFDIDGPLTVGRKPTKREEYVGRAFQGMIEIAETYEVLLDFDVYIRRFPFGSTRVEKVRYLRTQIGAYYIELNRLRKKLVSLVSTIEREFKSDTIYKQIRAPLKELCETVEESFGSIRDIRNSHLHQERYNSDHIAKITSARILDSLPLAYDLAYHEQAFKKARRLHLESARESNSVLGVILQHFFEVVNEILLTKEDRIRFPVSLREPGGGHRRYRSR